MEIPVLLYDRTAGTHGESVGREREDRCKHNRWRAGKSVLRSRRCDAERKEVVKRPISRWREKLLRSVQAPVPETDTGGRGENPETDGRTLVKELGKMTP